MKITILNSDSSKISPATEVKLLRAALLLAEEVVYAGNYSFLFNTDQLLSLPENIKYNFLEDIVKIAFKEVIIHEAMEKFIYGYRKYGSIKHKNKQQLLLYLRAKNGLDKILNMTTDKFRSLAEDVSIAELITLYSKDKKVIDPISLIFDFQDTKAAKNRIDSITAFYDMIGNLFFLDANVFQIAEPIKFDSIPKDFTYKKELNFLYAELATLPSTGKLSSEHFSIIRNNYLLETELFRFFFKQVEDLIYRLPYIDDIAEGISELFSTVIKTNPYFEKVKEENQLLKSLIENRTIVSYDKIYFCITSKENLMSMMEKLSIIDTRDKLYISEMVNRYADTITCFPFLILEEANNEH